MNDKKLIAALLAPTIETMRRSGIRRLDMDTDRQGALATFWTGEAVPIQIQDEPIRLLQCLLKRVGADDHARIYELLDQLGALPSNPARSGHESKP